MDSNYSFSFLIIIDISEMDEQRYNSVLRLKKNVHSFLYDKISTLFCMT